MSALDTILKGIIYAIIWLAVAVMIIILGIQVFR